MTIYNLLRVFISLSFFFFSILRDLHYLQIFLVYIIISKHNKIWIAYKIQCHSSSWNIRYNSIKLISQNALYMHMHIFCAYHLENQIENTLHSHNTINKLNGDMPPLFELLKMWALNTKETLHLKSVKQISNKFK